MTKITIGIPFYAALAAAFTEAGNQNCAPCFKTLSQLAAMTRLSDGHRTVFDAFTIAAKRLGFTGDMQIVRQTSVSLMSKDYALISKTFSIPADIIGACGPGKQVPYDQAIVSMFKSLADTNGDKKAYEALAQLVGETKLDEECRTAIFNALYESAKTLNMIHHDVVITAAAAVMWQSPSVVSQKFGVKAERIHDIVAALQAKPKSTDTKHASSPSSGSSSSGSDKSKKSDQHRHTTVPPKQAPAQQSSQPHARMTGGGRVA